MIKYFSVAAGAVLLAACGNYATTAATAGEDNQSRLHMGHVTTSWNDTPEQIFKICHLELEIAGFAVIGWH